MMYAAASLRVVIFCPSAERLDRRTGGARASKGSNEPGRVVLLCGIISLRALAAFIAAHLRPELVEGDGAQHRYSLAEHRERHPDRALAALASDPRITLGLKLRDGTIVCQPRALSRVDLTCLVCSRG
jgi:hypothetical protein